MNENRFFSRYALTLLSVAAVLWLTLAPDPLPDNDAELWPGFDKCVHLLMMGEICGVWLWNRFSGRAVKISGILMIVVAVAAFAAIIEIVQEWMGMGRSGDVGDWEAGCMGVAAAAVAWTLGRYSQPRQS